MKRLEDFQNEYMIKVKGGKYKPSFANELKEVFDIEVCISNNSKNVVRSDEK